MMTKPLLCGYSVGVTSIREIERRCEADVAFRYLAANVVPDHRSVARFRRRHLEAVQDLFTQVLVLCPRAGLVKLGRLALDGTKVRAAVSRHRAMSYDRLQRSEAELRAEVEPREKAAAEAAEAARAQGHDEDEVARRAKEAGAAAVPSPKAQPNVTDPDARIMKSADGSFHYAYNAQAVIDEAHQVIVSTAAVQAPTDVKELLPMIEETPKSLDAASIDAKAKVLLADAGYCSNANLAATAELEPEVLIAVGRMKHHEVVPDAPRGRIPKNATARERMARRLRTKGRPHYARRKAIVEPVFGQMKTRQRAGLLRLRGLSGARREWLLHGLYPYLRKLENADFCPATT